MYTSAVIISVDVGKDSPFRFWLINSPASMSMSSVHPYPCVPAFLSIITPIVPYTYLIEFAYHSPPKHRSDCGYTVWMNPSWHLQLFDVGIALDLGLFILQPFVFYSSLHNVVSELFCYHCSFFQRTESAWHRSGCGLSYTQTPSFKITMDPLTFLGMINCFMLQFYLHIRINAPVPSLQLDLHQQREYPLTCENCI